MGPPPALLLGDQAGQADRALVQYSSWVLLYCTPKTEYPHPPHPPFLTHCLAVINLGQPDNDIFSGDQQGAQHNRLISYYYVKYLCASRSSTNVSQQHCCEGEGYH